MKNFQRLTPPIVCDCCNSRNIILTTNELLYKKKCEYVRYVYFCNTCRASVLCHPNSIQPLGRMANKETRQYRREAHAAFDRIWKNRIMIREEAYQWLANELNISIAECHIGLLSIKQLKYAIKISNVLFANSKKGSFKKGASSETSKRRVSKYNKKNPKRRFKYTGNAGERF